jgi:NMD protein affecting ribosome stability and mRNA decay
MKKRYLWVQLTPEEFESAVQNGHCHLPRIVGLCDDCENESDNLKPYKYEPSVLICEDCTEERMKEGQK